MTNGSNDQQKLAAPSKEARQRSFTGDKLDWMTALIADDRVDSDAKVVGFCIAQHINADTGIAMLSDETIGHKTARSRREVVRARMDLKGTGWIDWKRTGSANVYWTLGDPIHSVMRRQQSLKQTRDRKRQARVSRDDVSALAHLKARDVPSLAHLPRPKSASTAGDVSAPAHHDVPAPTHHDVPGLAHIHLRENTLEKTPSLRGEQTIDPDDLPL